MQKAKVRLTHTQLEKLKNGGELTIRLRETQLTLSASTHIEDIAKGFLDDFLGGFKQ
jgi:hypothetical protein